jgi:ribonuclease-3
MNSPSESHSEPLPFNLDNTLLDDASLRMLIGQFLPSYTYSDINLFRNAFVHKSYCTRKNENFAEGNALCPPGCLPLQEESNERLEFLGDAVLNLIIGNYLFQRYPDESEGFLTKMRTKLVCGTMLAELAHFAKLPRFLIISKQIDENNGRNNKKILEDSFEAFLGALFLDAGSQGLNSMDIASDWIINLIEENIDFSELITQNTNYKDTFIKFYQHQHNMLPRFFELNTEITNNSKIFRVAIKDKNGSVISTGTGMSKKLAENDAALNALKYYGAL